MIKKLGGEFLLSTESVVIVLYFLYKFRNIALDLGNVSDTHITVVVCIEQRVDVFVVQVDIHYFRECALRMLR